MHIHEETHQNNHIRPEILSIAVVTQDDLDDLFALAEQSYNESAHTYLPFDNEMVRQLFLDSMDNPNYAFAIKALYGDDIVGYFLGSLVNRSFSRSPIATEDSFYVARNMRWSSAAIKMFDSFFSWAKNVGAVAAIASITHSKDNEKVYRLCEGIGMREIGRIFERRF